MIPVALGCFFHTVQYLAGTALWNDEQLLALNVGRRTALALLRPLDHNQSAPVGFLLIERLISRVFGMGELSLRLLPYLAGMAFVILGVLIARRLVRAEAAVVAATLFAFSPTVMNYAKAVKPYSLDAAFAALLFWLALRAIDEPSPRRLTQLGVAGAVAIWCSSPALFVLVAVAAALVAGWARQDHAWRRRCAVVLGTWLVCGALNYLLFLRESQADAYLRQYMATAMPSLSGKGVALAWELLVGEVLAVTLLPATYFVKSVGVFGAFILAIAFAGVVELRRRRGWPAAILFAAPFGVALAAAFLHMYPFKARLQLWLATPLILLFVVALEAVLDRFPSRARLPALAVCALAVLATSGKTARYRAFNVPVTENPRPLVRQWRAARSDAPVYVAPRGVSAWAYYSTDWSRPDTARLDWYAVEAGVGGRAFRNAAGRGHAVLSEGDDLVFRAGGRSELLGTSSGMQMTLAGLSQYSPDPGWAENEARRIRAAANPEIWLFFAHHIFGEHEMVVRAAEALGGHKVFERLEPGAALYRLRF